MLLKSSVKLTAFSGMSGMSACSPCSPGSYYSFYGNAPLLPRGHASRGLSCFVRHGEKVREPFQLANAATPAAGSATERQRKNAHSEELQEDSSHCAAFT